MLNIVRFFSLIRYVVSEYLVIEEDNDVSLKNVLCCIEHFLKHKTLTRRMMTRCQTFQHLDCVPDVS